MTIITGFFDQEDRDSYELVIADADHSHVEDDCGEHSFLCWCQPDPIWEEDMIERLYAIVLNARFNPDQWERDGCPDYS